MHTFELILCDQKDLNTWMLVMLQQQLDILPALHKNKSQFTFVLILQGARLSIIIMNRRVEFTSWPEKKETFSITTINIMQMTSYGHLVDYVSFPQKSQGENQIP